MMSRQAWARLEAEPATCLVDVRTTAEWTYVGLPDLSALGKRVALVAWQEFPSGRIDPDFVRHLEDAGVSRESTVLFICRSGARSLAAAEVAFEAGYADVHNVADGFEGTHDAAGRRGTVSGWKSAGLPWRQS